MNVSVVAFDYGNTLVLDPFDKVMELKANDFQRIIESSGYELRRIKLVNCWTKANETVNYPFCSHFYQEIPIIKNFLERLGVLKKDRNKLANELLAAYREGLKIVVKRDKRIREVREVLKELEIRRKKLMVLTNDRRDGIRTVLFWTGLDKFFKKILISETLRIEKPDPRIFKYLIKISGVDNEDIVYIGDDPERDIKPSKELGMKSILLKHPESSSVYSWRNYKFKLDRKHKPDFVVKDLKEILNILY